MPGQVQITLSHPLVKFVAFLLHSIRSSRALHSCARRFQIDIEQKSDIGNALADGQTVELLNHLSIELSRCSLINRGRIKKAIGDNTVPAGERRSDNFANELAPARFKQKQFRLRR